MIQDFLPREEHRLLRGSAWFFPVPYRRQECIQNQRKSGCEASYDLQADTGEDEGLDLDPYGTVRAAHVVLGPTFESAIAGLLVRHQLSDSVFPIAQVVRYEDEYHQSNAIASVAQLHEAGREGVRRRYLQGAPIVRH